MQHFWRVTAPLKTSRRNGSSEHPEDHHCDAVGFTREAQCMAPLLYRLLGPAKAPTPHAAPTPRLPPLPPPSVQALLPPPLVLQSPPPPDLSIAPQPSPPPADIVLDEVLQDGKRLYG